MSLEQQVEEVRLEEQNLRAELERDVIEPLRREVEALTRESVPVAHATALAVAIHTFLDDPEGGNPDWLRAQASDVPAAAAALVQRMESLEREVQRVDHDAPPVPSVPVARVREVLDDVAERAHEVLAPAGGAVSGDECDAVKSAVQEVKWMLRLDEKGTT